MHPTISIQLGGQSYSLASYGFFISAGAILAIGLSLLLASRQGLPLRRTLLVLLAVTAASPAGARLMDAATKPVLYLGEPGRLLETGFAGFSLYGALVLSGVAGVVACRALSLPAARMAGALAPGLWAGLAVARVGCYLAGCCFGEVTTLPWGVAFPFGSPAHLHQMAHGLGPFSLSPLPVHPLQLYESAAALGCAAFAAWMLRSGTPDGTPLLASLWAFTAFRLAVHPLRVPGPALATPDWFYPALYLVVMVAAGGALLVRTGRHPVPA